ncbi:MAG: hypothetical protein GY852_10275, partial [bacterium]|nr:hypothetical protein [bacterium]
PRRGSKEAIKEINKKFPVVFLQTSLVGVRAVKAWLKEHDFQQLPVVPWRQGAILDQIVKKDLGIKAIIAGPAVIETARGHDPLAFSFESTEGAKKVKNWKKINEKLQ